MLRVNQENYNVYGFEGEGGHLTFTDVPETHGEIALKIKGKETVEKRSLVFGQSEFSFILTDEDVNKIGVGTFPYYITTIDEDGHKSTLLPDLSTNVRPTITIEAQ